MSDSGSAYWVGRFNAAKAEWERVYQSDVDGREEIMEKLEDELAILSLAISFTGVAGG